MKKSIIFFSLLISSCFSHAQNGLENIIVEKYYVSDANDTANSIAGGILLIGSTTYRIYLDMKPGYKFQAAFGIPGHELKIATTTKFFNNTYKGRTAGNVIPYVNLRENTVMLDSWLSTGATSEGTVGVLKEEDDTVVTVAHENNFLKNNSRDIQIPLTRRDGLKIVGVGKTPKITFFGLDNDLKIFDNTTVASVFSTSNGSWACLYGSSGLDSLSNKVLIAQLTTDGILSFELNIQLGTPYGGIERYVAKNPIDNEILFPGLIYNSSTINEESYKNKSTKKTISN